jgi:hypothetical protein
MSLIVRDMAVRHGNTTAKCLSYVPGYGSPSRQYNRRQQCQNRLILIMQDVQQRLHQRRRVHPRAVRESRRPHWLGNDLAF